MHGFKYVALTAVAGLSFLATSTKPAQGQISVNIGAAPSCPYGYYGPEWFTGGVFIGAGPWFHGPANFHGHVDNHFHPDHGYRGPAPRPGDHVEAGREHPPANFHGNEVHDGHGGRH